MAARWPRAAEKDKLTRGSVRPATGNPETEISMKPNRTIPMKFSAGETMLLQCVLDVFAIEMRHALRTRGRDAADYPELASAMRLMRRLARARLKHRPDYPFPGRNLIECAEDSVEVRRIIAATRSKPGR